MKQQLMKSIAGWTIILVTIFSAVLIYFFQQFSLLFLLLLLFEIVLAVRYRKIFTPAMVRVSQILIGLLFLFSGFVKAVDPLGTAYRIEDYLHAYGLQHDFTVALILSFVLNAAELLLGGLILLNIKPRVTPWLVAFMMGVFTLTTLYDALYNPVPDCGCFGDAVKMTNWQTFYKNLVINVFVLIAVFGRLRLRAVYGNVAEWSAAVVLAALFVWFQYFNFSDLPILDFRPYKVGNRITPENPQPVKNFLTYKNKITGETKEYLSPNFPFDDPEWLENWEFVEMRTEDPNRISGVNLAIVDMNGDDVTQMIAQNPDYQFFVVAWNLEKTNIEAFQKINEWSKQTEEKGIRLIALTSSEDSVISRFIEENELNSAIEFFHGDDTELKAMVRANPGLILIKNGLIIQNWHHNKIPDWEWLNDTYFDDL